MNDINLIPYRAGRFISPGKGRHGTRTIKTSEIIFCIKSSLSMFEDDNVFHLKPGDYLILRKGHRHGGVSDYPSGLSFFWLHFDCDDRLFDILPQCGHAARPEQLALYFQSYLAELQLKKPSEESLRLLLHLILLEFKRSEINDNPSRTISKLALKAAEIIKLNFSTPLNIDSVAQILHCNSEYLGRIFHLHFKETFASMLNRIRVEYAAKLLNENKLSIKEIISECGFNDPAYFRRIFYRYYASTPSDFRKFFNSGHLNNI